MGENMGRIGARVSALLTVGVLLSGCGVLGPGPGAEAEGSPAESVASPDPTRPVSADPEPTVPASTAPAKPPAAPEVLPPAELEARVAGLLDAQGRPFTPVPPDQQAAGMDLVKMGLDAAVIEPAACAEMANKSLQQIPEDAAAAAGIGIPDPAGSITVVSLASNDNPDLLAQSLDINTSGCTEFTMTIEGQTVSVTMEELPIDPVGGETVSFLMAQALPTGQTMYIIGVMAREGATVASAQQIGTTEPDLVTQDELGRLAGELLTGKPVSG
ncbi:MAG: hypothetical protein AVDCRST_MAG83-1652 [uncultured Arthrobacter sp.]|uniref:DUF5642 domain-containing protein n=2 Tax=uncultured Arthrobacter sp. TaxID=114050 RepID=A0A6J4I5Q1_9MICC|nr:MAG: hypothetical protein AVDCRST_MAG83-1652 [uncultured Arthrobacter sp.]